MKTFIIAFATLLFAVLTGMIVFSLVGPSQPDPENSKQLLLGENPLEDADDMAFQLVTSVVSAAVAGTFFVVFVVPKIALAVANVAYDQSSQKFIAPTHLDEGRSFVMQGEYEKAIESFRNAIEEDEPDRLAWVEIAQIELEEYENPAAAIGTLKEGHEAHDWESEDDINFRNRIAEIYLEHENNRDEAVKYLKGILEDYSENELQCNAARHKLHELGVVA